MMTRKMGKVMTGTMTTIRRGCRRRDTAVTGGSRFAVAAAAWFLACGGATAAAHPFHASIAEAEWNAKSGRLEVSLRVTPNDLERAIRQRTKERVQLEDSKSADRLIQDYLREVMRVEGQGGRKHKLVWVGKEVSVKEAWLHFEIEMPHGPHGALISNRVLFDVQKEQINTINVRWKDQRKSLRFTRQKPQQRLLLSDEE